MGFIKNQKKSNASAATQDSRTATTIASSQNMPSLFSSSPDTSPKTDSSDKKLQSGMNIFTEAINATSLPTPPPPTPATNNRTPRPMESPMSPEGIRLKIVSSPSKGPTPLHGTISPTRVSTLQNLSLPLPSPGPSGPGNILPAESDLDIEEGTPAAEALRANADVKVTKLVKVARALHANSVRRVLKKSVGAGMGVKRGKPPRLPDLEADGVDDDQGVMDSMKHQGRPLDILKESEAEHLDEDPEKMEDPKHQSTHSQISLPDPDSMGLGFFSKSSEDESLVLSPSEKEFKKQNSFMTQQSLTLLDTKGKKREVKLIRRSEKKKEKKLKRLEKKKARNYVKGKVIDGEHELYTLSIAMMLGLRYSIFLTNNQLKEDKENGRFWLDSDEFMKVEKYSFRPDGRNNTPPHKLSHTFKFKDYSPLPFAFIRRMFGINEYEFHHSVCGNANFIEFISNAKSGQFFFYSSDGKYMIKTMTNAESKFLRRILPHYFRHCCQNPNTILTRFLGMYRVKLYHLRRNVKFVIMNSVFDTDKLLSSFYDLKGSVFGRDAKPSESVQKDNDLRRDIPESTIRLQPKVRERLREQVRRDCEFLKDMEIMDYSMLVGIHYIPSKNSKPKDPIKGRVFRGSKASYKLERARSDSAAIIGNTPNSATPKSPSIFSRLSFDKKHNRSRSEVFHVTKGSPTDENFHPSTSEKRVEFTLKDNAFDVRMAKSEERPSTETPLASCFPSFKSPFSPKDTSFDDSVVRPSDQSAISGSTIGIDIDDEASLLDVTKRSFLGDNSRMREDWMVEHAKIEQRRELAIEQNYWPFHRHFELNGDRRVVPMNASQLHVVENSPIGVRNTSFLNCLPDSGEGNSDLIEAKDDFTLEEFVPPISNRRDGGLTMDHYDLNFPLKVSFGGTTQECDGKIYYMGIIDILQQFNVRKRMEAKLRKIQGGSKGASCVHPNDYADRFVKFFDEYTTYPSLDSPVHEEEEVVFG